MTILAEVIRCFDRARGFLPAFLATHLALRLVVSALILPLASALIGLAIASSDRSALTDQDIARFLMTPSGALGALGVVSLLLAASVLDVAVMTVTLRQGTRSPLAAIWAGAGAIAPRFPRVLRFAAALILRLLALVLPFAAAAGAVAWVLLRRHDINYYLTWRPPEALLAAGLIAVIALALAAVLLPRLAGWTIALPLVLFRRSTPRAAFAESTALMRGRRRQVMGMILIWAAIRAGLAAAVAFGLGLAVSALPWVTGGNLRFTAAGILLLLAIWALANATVAAWAHGALAVLTSTLFAKATGAAPVTDDTTVRGPAPVLPLRALALVSVLAIGGALLAAGTLVARVTADRPVAVIAHRGAAALAPENTFAAVRRALDDGADWVEIDVQEAADGTVIVAHDSDFMKLGRSPLKVWNATADDLSKIDIGSWFGPDYAGERTPTLAEVLALAKGRAGVLIELKYYGHDIDLAARVVAEVEAAGMQEDKIATMSLKYPQVQAMAALRPDWRRGVLAARAVGDLTGLDADFLAVNTGQVSMRLLARAHAAGKQVYVWTVDDPLTMSRLISMGVDGLITNDPGLARRVIAERAALSAPERLLLWLADRYRLGSFPLTGNEQDA
jgi:glycerophosphoryl diester phosphodiesterase